MEKAEKTDTQTVSGKAERERHKDRERERESTDSKLHIDSDKSYSDNGSTRNDTFKRRKERKMCDNLYKTARWITSARVPAEIESSQIVCRCVEGSRSRLRKYTYRNRHSRSLLKREFCYMSALCEELQPL